ncbi:nitroreductase family deazaflavin-dependent oxidoreductase [Nocardia cyriacigeorgica]|uniref:nitroreductase family deazaflavin-dependent oxidoreductase n=1 Tax=Nocardia cyriacigeorgica TaxID=135487 RepID=UPI0018934733|nr:nitroreductase family deazaflavin-dependent oxidoreductase [Nocardia cyriacigeorgica]MBF6090146.1 nitroreductase family deazaflavin-dependent oxidoreductase [Nocardia cyriacigeorgica]MBF6094669.1 nitroreductase family deazaflavin-dependent oxidoreductase [Nocardia cyriacigeorgica]MBF6399335.1 nitroreductase family deazaflavin-dependent oxidoreductase [Nocardia cyriacigeorgica]MBF6404965.1 nitroreductase family deazaflavin-dependent oxidoreductase [Nocardia cyriacigeorgica]
MDKHRSTALRHVDPERKPSRVYRLVERFVRSRAGEAYVRNVGSHIDPWLDRVTRGRLMKREWLIATATLTTSGAKSGMPRSVQVGYFHDGQDVVVVASNYGGAVHPQWYYNLIAHPDCQLGGEPFVATEVADAAEYERLYALAEKVYAGWGDYRYKTAAVGRHIPVFRLTPR